MLKKLKNNNKGITLVALIVTIIVLAILSSITLGLLTEDNGIILHTQNAKNAIEEKDRQEQEIINNILEMTE